MVSRQGEIGSQLRRHLRELGATGCRPQSAAQQHGLQSTYDARVPGTNRITQQHTDPAVCAGPRHQLSLLVTTEGCNHGFNTTIRLTDSLGGYSLRFWPVFKFLAWG